MIVSNDSIIRPPYEISAHSIKRVAAISEKIGGINASFLIETAPNLRKRNQIKTIQSSLQIEGNTLSMDQVTAIVENKRILGPAKDILEVQNAVRVYNEIKSFKHDSLTSFLKAHQLLMKDLAEHPGRFRKKGVGIVKGPAVEHIAPLPTIVPQLMKNLFAYLMYDDEITLIKSCVFHYEMEFIHPFDDGNGRMGRLWQSVILMSEFPLFQYLPLETLIAANQEEYYRVLSLCDKKGNSSAFLEYMLVIIDEALGEMRDSASAIRLTQADRLKHFCEGGKKRFTRKDYMLAFKQLSSASASRDLKYGVEKGFFEKTGDKRNTVYHIL